MKRILFSILMAVVAMVASASVGDVFEYQNLKFSITKEPTNTQDGVATILGLSANGEAQTGYSLQILGGALHDGIWYRVEKVPSTALRGKTNFVNVTIGWGIKEVPASAFDGCTSLKFVSISSSVTVIGANAFRGCNALKEVSCAIPYPDDVSIASNAFPSNTGMKLHVPKTNPNSEDDYLVHPAFGAFSSITSDEKANDYYNVNGYYAIVTNAPSGGNPGEMTIVGCNTLTQNMLEIKPWKTAPMCGKEFRITSICSNAFFENEYLKSVDLTDATNLKVIGNGAFYGSAVETVNLGTTLTEIEPRAFMNCQKLTTLSIPASVTTIGGSFVEGAKNLTAIGVSSSNPNYASYYGMLYNKKRTELIVCPPGIDPQTLTRTGAITEDLFPKELTTVGRDAFYQCDKIEMLEFPYGLKELNFCSVYKCANLLEVSLPSTVTAFNDCSFYKCANLNVVRCNATTPPSVNPNIEFTGAPRAVLHVPYESIAAYKAAPRWNGFSIYGSGSYDAPSKDVSTKTEKFKVYYTIHSAKPETINGTAYDGRAKLSCVPPISTAYSSVDLTLPEYITVKGKKYAVTAVASKACYNSPEVDTKVTLGVNVDTICDNAFKDTPRIVSLTLNSNLKYLGMYAFEGCSVAGKIDLPYGLQYIGANAFKGCPVTHLLVPSSVSTMNYYAFNGMSSLSSLVLNLSWPINSDRWVLTGIPTSCRLYVPSGYVNHYAENSKFRTLDVTAGAYDFTYDNALMDKTIYHVTITSNTPVTVDGVTYAGKAKYVCHPAHKSQSGQFYASLYETNRANGANKNYLMVELGDSLIDGCSNITSVNISEMKALERIGNYAFYSTGITSFTVPESVTHIGKGAFDVCRKLKELIVLPASPTLDDHFFLGNHADFKCYVKWTHYSIFKGLAASWPIEEGEQVDPVDRLNAFLKVENNVTATSFCVDHPVDWVKSGLKAYVVSSYNKGENKAYTSEVIRTRAATGLLVDGFEVGKVHKLERTTGPYSLHDNLLVGTTLLPVNVFNKNVGFCFDRADKYFWRPTSTYRLSSGYAYLLLPSEDAGTVTRVEVDRWAKAVKGDVNGDGVVNVSDVTALINKILGTATYTDTVCDINGDGQVNVSDVTALINMILG